MALITVPSSPGGIWTKNPLELPRGLASTLKMKLPKDGTTTLLPADAAFWSTVDQKGAYAAASSGVKTTVVDITGEGIATVIITPAPDTTATKHDVTITVDGKPYVISMVIKNGYRGIIGPCPPGELAADSGNQVNTWHGSTGAMQLFSTYGSGIIDQVVAIPTPYQAMMAGWPCLKFDKSLKVEVEVDVIYTGAENGGCLYIV